MRVIEVSLFGYGPAYNEQLAGIGDIGWIIFSLGSTGFGYEDVNQALDDHQMYIDWEDGLIFPYDQYAFLYPLYTELAQADEPLAYVKVKWKKIS